MKKLLFVYPATDLGGAAHYILSIVRYLPRAKYDIQFALPGKGPFTDALAREHLLTHDLDIDYTTFSFMKSIVRFRLFLMKNKFDLVHVHTAKGGLLVSLAAIRLPVKTVYTGHVVNLPRTKPFPFGLLFSFFERLLYRVSTFSTLLSMSEYEAGVESGMLDPRKTRVISMSIDAARFSAVPSNARMDIRRLFGIDPSAFVVGMLGRLTRQKDPECFVKAGLNILSKISNTSLVWIGDGDLREETERFVQQSAAADRFIVTGHQDAESIPTLLSAVDVLLFTSNFEGLPIAVLEAMASRTFIVAADVGAIKDIVRHGVTGWLFPQGDFRAAASLVCDVHDKMTSLSHILDQAHDLVVRNYGPAEKMSREFQEVYDSLMTRSGEVSAGERITISLRG